MPGFSSGMPVSDDLQHRLPRISWQLHLWARTAPKYVNKLQQSGSNHHQKLMSRMVTEEERPSTASRGSVCSASVCGHQPVKSPSKAAATSDKGADAWRPLMSAACRDRPHGATATPARAAAAAAAAKAAGGQNEMSLAAVREPWLPLRLVLVRVGAAAHVRGFLSGQRITCAACEKK